MSQPPRPLVCLIAAVARDNAIGRGNELLWVNREDQKHFRALTMGHTVIMGRKTWDSLPERFRPLPGRRNIVVTRNPLWQTAGAERAASLDAALDLTRGLDQVFVIGGAQLYALALPLADVLELTEIDAPFDTADVFFPSWPREAFDTVQQQERIADDGTPYRFVTYRLRPTTA